MRYAPAVIAVALAAAVSACAADHNPAADAAAAEAAVADFFRAMESWDIASLRATVTPDFELVEDTVIMSMDDFVAFIAPFEQQDAVMTWQLSDYNTKVAGGVAWTRYTNRAVLHMTGQESRFHWIESAVVLRQPDGSWKIDRLQSTPVSVEGALAESG
jgi:ketosteroid isomerase-like protein